MSRPPSLAAALVFADKARHARRASPRIYRRLRRHRGMQPRHLSRRTHRATAQPDLRLELRGTLRRKSRERRQRRDHV
ncbi:MAG: hypothetical protein UY72_C0005G0010 [Candidatus Uhrbacteria bacterium GW2011_GWD2_52_7]|uniref:Uncharacterized protein n=1 Tax=Candidatus Uhrbacteria bacterium GW2011_GWD2_52_7 TaxID=1618989 RepID=A0A0G2AE35_9BACT|nr:MAG: hypothetical protein UY72_C0005G0010 [Candidatus Uhrbacteria bacterium GW2011_GWD2_52_7]